MFEENKCRRHGFTFVTEKRMNELQQYMERKGNKNMTGNKRETKPEVLTQTKR